MGQWMSHSTSNEDRLLHACEEGRYHQVAALLQQQQKNGSAPLVNINCHDPMDGDTPLHKACRHAMFYQGTLHIVECLLQHGANVNALDRGRSTPLHWACVYHDVELVRLLVQYGASIHVRDPLDQTPLHKAHDCLAIVQFLVQECHADVSAKDCFGFTLQDRLTQELQHDLVAREFSNAQDCHAKKAQQVMEFLQHHDTTISNNTATRSKGSAITQPLPLLEKKSSTSSCRKTTTATMTQIPEETVAENDSHNPQDGAGNIDDDDGSNCVAIENKRENYQGSPKPGFQRQSARIQDSFRLSQDEEEKGEQKSAVESSASSSPSPPLQDDINVNDKHSNHHHQHRGFFLRHFFWGPSSLRDNDKPTSPHSATTLVQCIDPADKQGDGLLRDVMKSERVKL